MLCKNLIVNVGYTMDSVIYRCHKQINVKIPFLSFSQKIYPSKITVCAVDYEKMLGKRLQNVYLMPGQFLDSQRFR